MNIGIFYATYSGGTQAASEFLTETLKTAGHTVTAKTIGQTNFDETLTYDLRIFASPSWDDADKEGQPHVDFTAFITASAGKNFGGKPVAVFGLGDSSYAHFCGAVDIIVDFVKTAGGKLIGEPLKIDGYLFNMDENNKKISEWANTLKI